MSKYRIYDPELGIFLSRDFLPYLNKYRAWSNDPVGQIDKTGLAQEAGPDLTAIVKEIRAELNVRQSEHAGNDAQVVTEGSAFSIPALEFGLIEKNPDSPNYLAYSEKLKDAIRRIVRRMILKNTSEITKLEEEMTELIDKVGPERRETFYLTLQLTVGFCCGPKAVKELDTAFKETARWLKSVKKPVGIVGFMEKLTETGDKYPLLKTVMSKISTALTAASIWNKLDQHKNAEAAVEATKWLLGFAQRMVGKASVKAAVKAGATQAAAKVGGMIAGTIVSAVGMVAMLMDVEAEWTVARAKYETMVNSREKCRWALDRLMSSYHAVLGFEDTLLRKNKRWASIIKDNDRLEEILTGLEGKRDKFFEGS